MEDRPDWQIHTLSPQSSDTPLLFFSPHSYTGGICNVTKKNSGLRINNGVDLYWSCNVIRGKLYTNLIGGTFWSSSCFTGYQPWKRHTVCHCVFGNFSSANQPLHLFSAPKENVPSTWTFKLFIQNLKAQTEHPAHPPPNAVCIFFPISLFRRQNS